MPNEATRRGAAVKNRIMEVFQLTLNGDGSVDAALRLPNGSTDPAMMGVGAESRVRYDTQAEAPTLGQKIDVAFTPVP